MIAPSRSTAGASASSVISVLLESFPGGYRGGARLAFAAAAAPIGTRYRFVSRRTVPILRRSLHNARGACLGVRSGASPRRDRASDMPTQPLDRNRYLTPIGDNAASASAVADRRSDLDVAGVAVVRVAGLEAPRNHSARSADEPCVHCSRLCAPSRSSPTASAAPTAFLDVARLEVARARTPSAPRRRRSSRPAAPGGRGRGWRSRGRSAAAGARSPRSRAPSARGARSRARPRRPRRGRPRRRTAARAAARTRGRGRPCCRPGSRTAPTRTTPARSRRSAFPR